MNIQGFSSYPNPPIAHIDDLYSTSKRKHTTSDTSAEKIYKDNFSNNGISAPNASPPVRRLGDIRRSFEGCLARSEGKATWLSRTASDSKSHALVSELASFAPAVELEDRLQKTMSSPKTRSTQAQNQSADESPTRHRTTSLASHTGRSGRRSTLKLKSPGKQAADLKLEIQSEPIELPSDECTFSSDDEAANFLLKEMPEHNDKSKTLYEGQSGNKTQISVSDTAFESQSPSQHHPAYERMMMSVQHRKQAYKAAKELGGMWEADHGLISSSNGHGEEELEL
ncbi:hypothetical protein MMC28_011651 [Mycoblastus sanguinarius]|nr:hypothetical protein [Mycoblastus sanguinarius]